MKTIKKNIALTVLFILILLISSILLLEYEIGGIMTNPFNNKKFDSEIWKTQKTDVYKRNNARAYMIEDLIKNYLKKGMHTKTVIKMLGLPEKGFESSVFEYVLGMPIGIDYYILIIEFDNDVIKKYHYRQT